MEQRWRRFFEAFKSTEISTPSATNDQSKTPAKTSRATNKQTRDSRINTSGRRSNTDHCDSFAGCKSRHQPAKPRVFNGRQAGDPHHQQDNETNEEPHRRNVNSILPSTAKMNNISARQRSSVFFFGKRRQAIYVVLERFCAIILGIVNGEIIGGT